MKIHKLYVSASVTEETLADEDSNKCSEIAYREQGGETAGYIAFQHTYNGQSDLLLFQTILSKPDRLFNAH